MVWPDWFYGVSHAQSEPDLVGMLLVLINGTQNDVDALELRVEQVESANAMLEQRIAVLEQAGNATASGNATAPATAPVQDAGSSSAPDTHVPEEPPRCGPGEWLNMDTYRCEAVQEDGPPRCGPGEWLNMDTGACELIESP